eukprot:TRINITY_DN10657_c0_g1_i1.p1 TRINITY_DN10657_c0_g1~~TRINITY_DN10657_c0_g1_i1.p1  ORF type:complete len:553 (+),score=95.56 TRINITY_DN10657_c0_g1_i1:58-1716(+)
MEIYDGVPIDDYLSLFYIRHVDFTFHKNLKMCMILKNVFKEIYTSQSFKGKEGRFDCGFFMLVKRSEKRVFLYVDVCEVAVFGAVKGIGSFSVESLLGGDVGVVRQIDVSVYDNGNEVGVLSIGFEMWDFNLVNACFWDIILMQEQFCSEGVVSKSQFKSIFKFLDVDKSHIRSMMRDIDLENGISSEEFKYMILDNELFRDILHSNTFLVSSIWETVCYCQNHADFSVILLNSIQNIKDKTETLNDPKSIFVQDRETGEITKEKMPSYIKSAMKFLYNTGVGKSFIKSGMGKDTLVNASKHMGKVYSEPKSVSEIPAFIKFHNINMDEFERGPDEFVSFNDFFTREIKLDRRPIDPDPNVIVSPADCRLHAYENIETAMRLWIKGRTFSLENLLEDEALIEEFQGCSLVIARLAPQDYHRFHFPVDGQLGDFIYQGDHLYTVNPIGITCSVDVYCENKRISVLMENDIIGKVMYISIGATLVGSTVLTSTENTFVHKGDQHGYFEYGGSTILLLFQRGRITLDEDLLLNSSNKIETLVKMGSRIGIAQHPH